MELALIAGGFTILGVLLGSLITFYFSLELAKRISRKDAGRRLREAFHIEQAAFDASALSERIGIEEMLRAAWPRHHAAVSEMKFYLPPKKAAQLDEAWQKYHLLGGKIRFDQYVSQGTPDELRTKFNERVEAILKFTNV
jgi:hypothetical protein